MENKGTTDTIKILLDWFSSFKEVIAEESWGTASVFSTVAALCKVAHWAFDTTDAAVLKVVEALYRG